MPEKYQYLLFRRQFLVSDIPFENYKNWHTHVVFHAARQFRIIWHPDLEFTSAEKNYAIYLLGYALNPFKPEMSNQDIVEELAKCNNCDAIFSKTDFLNGRYALIIADHHNLKIINDATSSKQVYYLFKDKQFFVGSSPDIISRITRCRRTKNRDLLDYYHSSLYQNANQAWFGTETPFQDVMILQPNHFLDLINRRVRRFWPRYPRKKMKINESVEYVSYIMKGTVQAALNRYTLHCSLTAGYDSRMILSSLKHFKDQIQYYTLNSLHFRHLNKADIELPEKIANDYGLNHNFINITGEKIDNKFVEIYKRNNVLNRNVFIEAYYRYINQGHENKLNLTGIMGDQLLRANFRLCGQITAYKLAERFHVQNFKFVVNSIYQWLIEALPIYPNYNIHLIDWFNWECYCASWAGIAATEHDIARDELRMFNCRELFTTFMLIHPYFRYKDNPKIHKMVIKHNWRSLLRYKLVPSNVQYRFCKKILRILCIEPLVNRLYQKSKYFIKSK